ncbi:hypothetical protein M413DRAFT_155638 [Hebeloma cylindrosporum]|uniref:Uncharacterized protein n=1 Tax=Hebeloma cylindrosporum TaxID=76867 RepID=A0A0C3C9K5_HEBCY|nr:hypothetical protein M413DRAFT_155638 [Hebeloma cylindrosporum h7]
MCDVCKYPEKTKARFLKLSSQDEARVNVPRSMYSGNTYDSKGALPNRFPGQENKNVPTGATYGAQKRPGADFVEGSSKKPKVVSAPIFVTKPFGSTSGLSKPFKPPSFVNKAAGSNSSNSLPPPPPVVPKPPIARPSVGKVNRPVGVPITRVPKVRVEEEIPIHVEDEELSPDLELPDLYLPWEPGHSTKVSVDHRKEAFASLRRRLHTIFTLPLLNDDYWEKVSERELSEDEKNEILFKVASELEESAISMSSTLEGYDSRIDVIRGDIKALSNLKRWDKGDDDFEDSQEIVQSLRESSKISSKRRDKKQAR